MEQKGDAPQAAELIEGSPAEVVMADTAYDANALRQAIAAKGAIAVIPNTRHGRSISARQASLRPASSGGVLFLKTQTIPPCRNPLRHRLNASRGAR
jgi:transposase